MPGCAVKNEGAAGGDGESAEVVSASGSPSSFSAYLIAKRATVSSNIQSRKSRYPRRIDNTGEEKTSPTPPVIQEEAEMNEKDDNGKE